MDLAAIPFRKTKYDGVRIHFYSSDRATGRVVALIAMDPGHGYPRHRHQGAEEVLVLQGGYRDELGEYRKGQFVRYEHGTVHSPVALDDAGAEVCVLFALSHEGIALFG
ncbi:allophanate hydrolase [Planctomycetota bacterium]|jgi:anti-sigma factor ChrR (cupin superfamily)|nr:cupin domain-containing protein [Planctomycetota bacterium]MSR39358.1 allophanate hydrolase [Planctomycetota bacterium]GDY02288.1 allophanate hydrolase [Planctomycetota bacterium]